ncbi:unnamed protein product [Linum tenue]|uniref:SKP1-like protein n=1 Tax=Linum tenue TaxID=586396 RepID=A0AAV0K6M6_9ROSI|nr:unnamed protein product [Linum tenue]CAI0417950.1 unnamed protein product [Linum tenue]
MQSQTIKHMIEDGCAGDGIPIPNVTGAILAKVLEFCKKHQHHAPDRQSDADELKKWDTNFANVSPGKKPEEIRQYFNIKNDFTKEEEEEIRRENQWAFE